MYDVKISSSIVQSMHDDIFILLKYYFVLSRVIPKKIINSCKIDINQ
ncbi:hypothetical protein MIDIC_230020 [Alphaproteobacteria bacterium]